MKKVVFFTVFVLTFFIALLVANASTTNVRDALKNYTITPVENALLMGKNMNAAWKISYTTKELPVTVVKIETDKGIEYLVQSKFFAVRYVLTDKGFGARFPKGDWCNVPKQINKAVINKQELARQEIISPNKVDDKTALDLIANYLPDLINDGYTHLLN